MHTQRKSHALIHVYHLPSLADASRFILLGVALAMLKYWQTIVGSGVMYMSKVQLYIISIFIDLQ